jgi:hypothetical protein
MKKLTLKPTQLALMVCALGVMPAQASDVKFSGFLSIGGGMVDDENSLAYQGYSEEDFNFNNNILGLQVSGTVAEKLTATAQFIARSNNDYNVGSEWAYLTYQATDSTKIRAGRLRTPFYMYSDFLDVGYAYSWITPPREVYYLPFNNVDGVDIYTTGAIGGFDTSLQAYFGSFDDELDFDGNMLPARTRNQMGVAGTIGKDWWTLRAAYHQAELSIDFTLVPISQTASVGSFANTLRAFGFSKNADNILTEKDKASFVELGLNIDTGRFVAAAEHVEFEPKDSFLSKNVREYVMVGVRAGDWLFHVTGSQSRDETAHPESGIPAGVALPVVGSTNVLIANLKGLAASQVVDRDVLTLGTRWDFTSSAALKLQFDSIDDNMPGGGSRDQKVFSVALQTVF